MQTFKTLISLFILLMGINVASAEDKKIRQLTNILQLTGTNTSTINSIAQKELINVLRDLFSKKVLTDESAFKESFYQYIDAIDNNRKVADLLYGIARSAPNLTSETSEQVNELQKNWTSSTDRIFLDALELVARQWASTKINYAQKKKDIDFNGSEANRILKALDKTPLSEPKTSLFYERLDAFIKKEEINVNNPQSRIDYALIALVKEIQENRNRTAINKKRLNDLTCVTALYQGLIAKQFSDNVDKLKEIQGNDNEIKKWLKDHDISSDGEEYQLIVNNLEKFNQRWQSFLKKQDEYPAAPTNPKSEKLGLGETCQKFYANSEIPENNRLNAFIRALEIDFYAVRRLLTAIPMQQQIIDDLDLTDKKVVDPILDKLFDQLPDTLKACQSKGFDDECVNEIAIKTLSQATQSFDAHLEFLQTVFKQPADAKLLLPKISQSVKKLCTAAKIKEISQDCEDTTNPHRLSCEDQQKVAKACSDKGNSLPQQIAPLLKLTWDIHAENLYQLKELSKKEANTLTQVKQAISAILKQSTEKSEQLEQSPADLKKQNGAIEAQIAAIRDKLLIDAKAQLVDLVIEQAIQQEITIQHTIPLSDDKTLGFILRPRSVQQNQITAELLFNLVQKGKYDRWIKTGLQADISLSLDKQSLNQQEVSQLLKEIQKEIEGKVKSAFQKATFTCPKSQKDDNDTNNDNNNGTNDNDDCSILQLIGGWNSRLVPNAVQFSIAKGVSIRLFETGSPLSIPLKNLFTIDKEKLHQQIEKFSQQIKQRLASHLKIDNITKTLQTILPVPLKGINQELLASKIQICSDQNKCLAKLRLNLVDLNDKLAGNFLVFHLSPTSETVYAKEESHLNLVSLLKSFFAETHFTVLDNCELMANTVQCDFNLSLKTGYQKIARVSLDDNYQVNFEIKEDINVPLAGGFSIHLKASDPFAFMEDAKNESSEIHWQTKQKQLTLQNIQLSAPIPFQSITGIKIYLTTNKGKVQLSIDSASKTKVIKMLEQTMATYLQPTQMTDIVDLKIDSELKIKLTFKEDGIQAAVQKVIERIDENWLENVQRELYTVGDQFRRFLEGNFNPFILKAKSELNQLWDEVNQRLKAPFQGNLDIGVGNIKYHCDNPIQKQIKIALNANKTITGPGYWYYRNCHFTFVPVEPAPNCPLTFTGTLDDDFKSHFRMAKNEETLSCLKNWVKRQLPNVNFANVNIQAQFDAQLKRFLFTMPVDLQGMTIPLQLSIDLEGQWSLTPTVTEFTKMVVDQTIAFEEKLAFAKTFPGLLALTGTHFDLRSLGILHFKTLTSEQRQKLNELRATIKLSDTGTLGYVCENPQDFGDYAKYQKCEFGLKTTQPLACKIYWQGKLGDNEKVTFKTNPNHVSSCNLEQIKTALKVNALFGSSTILTVGNLQVDFPDAVIPVSLTLPSLIDKSVTPLSTEVKLLINLSDLSKGKAQLEIKPSLKSLGSEFTNFEKQNAAKASVHKLANKLGAGDDLEKILTNCRRYQDKMLNSLEDFLKNANMAILETEKNGKKVKELRLEPGCPKKEDNLLKIASSLEKQALVFSFTWGLPGFELTVKNARYAFSIQNGKTEHDLDLSQASIQGKLDKQTGQEIQTATQTIRDFFKKHLGFLETFAEITVSDEYRFNKTALLVNWKVKLKLSNVGLEDITIPFDTTFDLINFKADIQADFIQPIRQVLWKQIATSLNEIGELDLGGSIVYLKAEKELTDEILGIVELTVDVYEQIQVKTKLLIPLGCNQQYCGLDFQTDIREVLAELIIKKIPIADLELPGNLTIPKNSIKPLWATKKAENYIPVGVRFNIAIGLPEKVQESIQDIPGLNVITKAFPIIVVAKIDQAGFAIEELKGFSIPLGPEIPIPPISLCNPTVTFTDEAISFRGDLTLAQCTLSYLLKMKGEFKLVFSSFAFSGDGKLVAFYLIPLGNSHINLDVKNGLAFQTMDIGGVLSSIIRLQGGAILRAGQNDAEIQHNHCLKEAADQIAGRSGIAACTNMTLFKIPVSEAQFYLSKEKIGALTKYDVSFLEGDASFQTKQKFRDPRLSMSTGFKVGSYTLADAHLGVALDEARLGFSFIGIELGLTVSELDELDKAAVWRILKNLLSLPSLDDLMSGLANLFSGKIRINLFSSFGKKRGSTYGKRGDAKNKTGKKPAHEPNPNGKGDFKDIKDTIERETPPNYDKPAKESKSEVLTTAMLGTGGPGDTGWVIKPHQNNLLVIKRTYKDKPEEPIHYVPLKMQQPINGKPTEVIHFKAQGDRFLSKGTTVTVGEGFYAHFLEQTAEVAKKIKTIKCDRHTTLYWFVESSDKKRRVAGRSFAGAWQYPFGDVEGLCYDKLNSAMENSLRQQALKAFIHGAVGQLASGAANKNKQQFEDIGDFVSQVLEFKTTAQGKPLHVVAVKYRDHTEMVYYIAGWKNEVVTLFISELDFDRIKANKAFTEAALEKLLPLQDEYHRQMPGIIADFKKNHPECKSKNLGWPGMYARVRKVGQQGFALETPLKILFWNGSQFAESKDVDINNPPLVGCPGSFFPEPAKEITKEYNEPKTDKKEVFPWWRECGIGEKCYGGAWFIGSQKDVSGTFKLNIFLINYSQEVEKSFELKASNSINGTILFQDNLFKGKALHLDPQRQGIVFIVPDSKGNECTGTLWWLYKKPGNNSRVSSASFALEGQHGDLCNGNKQLGFKKLKALWDDKQKGRKAFRLLLNLIRYTSEQILNSEQWNESPIESAKLLRDSNNNVQALWVKFKKYQGPTLFGFNSPTISSVKLLGKDSVVQLEKSLDAGNDDAFQFLKLVRQKAKENGETQAVLFDIEKSDNNQNSDLVFIDNRLYAALIGTKLFVLKTGNELFELISVLDFDAEKISLDNLAGYETQTVDGKKVDDLYARKAIQVSLKSLQNAQKLIQVTKAFIFKADYSKYGKKFPFAAVLSKTDDRYRINMQGSVPEPSQLIKKKRPKTQQGQCQGNTFENQVLKPWVAAVIQWQPPNDNNLNFPKVMEDARQQNIVNEYFPLLKEQLGYDQVFVALDCYMAKKEIDKTKDNERIHLFLRELRQLRNSADSKKLRQYGLEGHFDEMALAALAKILLAVYKAEYLEYQKDVLSKGDCRRADLAIHTEKTVNGKALTLAEIEKMPIFKTIFAENSCQKVTGDYYFVKDKTFRLEKGKLFYWNSNKFKKIIDKFEDKNSPIFFKLLEEKWEILTKAKSISITWFSNEALLFQTQKKTYLYTFDKDKRAIGIQLVNWDKLDKNNKNSLIGYLQTTTPSHVHVFKQAGKILLWQDNVIYDLTKKFEIGKVEQKKGYDTFNQNVLTWIHQVIKKQATCRIKSNSYFYKSLKESELLGLQWQNCKKYPSDIYTIYSPPTWKPLEIRIHDFEPQSQDFEILLKSEKNQS